MPRCADCAKFVSYGEINVDEIEVELDDTTLSLSGALNLTCAECGATVSSADMSAEDDVSDHFERQPDEEQGETAEYEYADDAEVEATDRSQAEARSRKTGKVTKSKSPRSVKRYYGVKVECVVRQKILDRGGNQVGEVEEETVTLEAEEQASAFEAVS